MNSWYQVMDREQKKTFWACWGGWALDGMDVQLFAFVIPALTTLWGMSQPQAGFISTAALVTSAIGGVLAGLLADRIGRVRVLQITIVWFAVFTALSAFTRNYHELLLTRSLQGVGFGGEWAAGTTLIGEVIHKEARGRAVGTVQGGWPVGYGVAALAYFACFSLLPENTAWRILFCIGVAPALSVIWLRRNVKDSNAYHTLSAKRKEGGIVRNFRLIFSREVIRNTATASLLAAGALGGNYTILTWLVSFLKQSHSLSVAMTAFFLAANIFGSFCGYMGAAHLSDIFGRRKTIVFSALGALLAITLYTVTPIYGTWLFALGFLVGMFQSGIVSGMGACFSELFPAEIRASAGGFSYNVGRAVGSLVPAAVGLTSGCFGLGHSIGAWAAAAYVLVFIGAVLLPETRSQELALHV